MTCLIGSEKYDDGEDYYNIGLDLVTGQIVQIKNAGCLAHAEKLVMDFLKINYSLFSSRVKIFFMGNCSGIDLNRIPKKYHKFFREVSK